MLSTGIAPVWLCMLFAVAVFIVLPLDAWLVAWPASVKDRDKRTNPRFHHE